MTRTGTWRPTVTRRIFRMTQTPGQWKLAWISRRCPPKHLPHSQSLSPPIKHGPNSVSVPSKVSQNASRRIQFQTHPRWARQAPLPLPAAPVPQQRVAQTPTTESPRATTFGACLFSCPEAFMSLQRVPDTAVWARASQDHLKP